MRKTKMSGAGIKILPPEGEKYISGTVFLCFLSGAILLGFLALVHYVGRLEGRIDTLQKTLSLQQQINNMVMLNQFTNNNRLNSGNTRKKNTRKTKYIESKPVNRERLIKLGENDNLLVNRDPDKANPNKVLAKKKLKVKKNEKNTKAVANTAPTQKEKHSVPEITEIPLSTEKNTSKRSNPLPQLSLTKITGRVLLVQARNKRVMLDLGASDGTSKGQRFTLWRQGRFVGEVRAKKIFAEMTAAEIISIAGSGIRVGDNAREVPLELASGPADDYSSPFKITNSFAK